MEDLRRALQQRDPLDKGFNDVWGLDLLSRLLRWDPRKRITASEALEHAYFKGPYVSSIDGSKHATPADLRDHESHVKQHIHSNGSGHGGGSGGDSASSKAPAIYYTHPFLVDREGGGMPSFFCPKCGRQFTSWNACDTHMVGRGHGRFCVYDTSALPDCISWHSMVPHDRHSGWCDVQGRRSGIEDFHTIVFTDDYRLYGVFDGHWGTRAAKFVSRELHANFEKLLALENDVSHATLEATMRSAFLCTNAEFVNLFKPKERSGTTATIALVYPDRLLVANVGDSRAIVCCDPEGRPVQLTRDHIASMEEERRRLKGLGARVIHRGVWRLEGELALSRSIGDLGYDKFLSREPHVVTQELGGSLEFMVLASDGLWDVMTNEEVVDFVKAKMEGYNAPKCRAGWHGEVYEEEVEPEGNDQCMPGEVALVEEVDYHTLAQALTWEAFVRGSTDNIGVCVVDLRLARDKGEESE